MKNEKQIVLFLKKNTTFNQTQLAAKMNEKFEELGNPAIIPPNEKDPNQPLIIFNQGVMNLTLNYNDLSFIFYEEEQEKLNDLIIEIVEFLEDYSLDFVRLGYVSTFLNTKKERDNFKKNMFKDENLMNDDFQISWYKKESIDSVVVNVWERHFTDLNNNIDFVSIFDINSPMEEEYNISSTFLDDFLKECNKYIEKKQNTRYK